MVPGGSRSPGTARGTSSALRHNGAVDLETFSPLMSDEGQRLLDEVAEFGDYAPERELALATRLRRDHPAPLVSAAMAQTRLRQRAGAKFGADAQRMYFTPDGVEQATRATVAAHRADRFAARGVRRVADLCCGIGGDALALARAGIEVLAVDRSPLACAVTAANARALGLADRIEVRCADVTDVDVAGFDAVFVDPARRGGRGRVFNPEAYSPPLSWAVRAARRVPHAAVKVAPGIPHEVVPEEADAEWVSDRGEVKEATLWFGGGPGRRATLLPGPHVLTGAAPGAAPRDGASGTSGAPRPGGPRGPHGEGTAPVGPVARYLYEPDGAVIRAHLVARVAELVGGTLIDPAIAYVTSPDLVATPFATAYQVTDVLPFHLKRLRALLRERGVGTAVIKKRGSAVEPEELRRRLALSGPHSCVVILTRVSGAPSMLLAQPAPGAGEAGAGAG